MKQLLVPPNPNGLSDPRVPSTGTRKRAALAARPCASISAPPHPAHLFTCSPLLVAAPALCLQQIRPPARLIRRYDPTPLRGLSHSRVEALTTLVAPPSARHRSHRSGHPQQRLPARATAWMLEPQRHPHPLNRTRSRTRRCPSRQYSARASASRLCLFPPHCLPTLHRVTPLLPSIPQIHGTLHPTLPSNQHRRTAGVAVDTRSPLC